MYINWFVYAALIIVLLWGAHFAGFGTRFNEDFLSLKATRSLRGFSTLCILLHHISQEVAFRQSKTLSLFPNIGYLFVGIFFFCSGYGLLKSLYTKPDYLKTFFKKRVLHMVVSFYVMTVIYAIYKVSTHAEMPVSRWILSFTGLVLINNQAWYVIVLLSFYIAFYFIFKNIKHKGLAFSLMLLVILAEGAVFVGGGHFAWWAGKTKWWYAPFAFQKEPWWKSLDTLWFQGEWWVNSSIAFFVGLLFAHWEDRIVSFFKKWYWLKLAALVVLTAAFMCLSFYCQGKISYWGEWSGKAPAALIFDRAVCYASQIPQVVFFTLFVFILMMKLYTVNPVTNFFGNLSLEAYLMQLIPVTLFRFLIFADGKPVFKENYTNLAAYLLLVMATTIAFALLYKATNKVVLKALGE